MGSAAQWGECSRDYGEDFEWEGVGSGEYFFFLFQYWMCSIRRGKKGF